MNDKGRAILEHLASRPGHDEVKADFRDLLIEEFGIDHSRLDFEHRVPEVRGRIDALVGRTIFEAKSDLRRELPDVYKRLPDYLADREQAEGERYVGIASDGLEWRAFELSNGELEEIGHIVLDPDNPQRFLAWLDGVLALKSALPPDAINIRMELGHSSVAWRRTRASLQALWEKLKDNPATALKRQLWASLLKLVYGRDVQNDELWLQHTYLVIVAKTIAFAVMELREDDPQKLLSGEAFTAANIHGAVESDFFDWVLADEEGHALVRKLLNHVRRFRLREVQTDVLKILYEELIDRAERHGLGEYYTPDWLAAKVVRETIRSPVEEKVLDPACGSGTFLFHAVRAFLEDAVDAGMAAKDMAAEACAHVAGLDIHPVAVIIARVTYLLALSPALAAREGAISIPVYLGDSLQLSVSEFIGTKKLSIHVPPPPAGHSRCGLPDGNGGEVLSFPETFCRDPGLFDKSIEQLRAASEQELARAQVEQALVRIVEQHYKRDITDEEETAIRDMGEAYETMLCLRRANRDSVWAYVARNLARPLFFSSATGWANVLIGNPPWVAYRHMSADLQKRFAALARGERLHVGGKLATHNDLAALFVVRASTLYLRPGGRLAFVMPLATLTRGQFEKFRSGSFTSTRIQFTAAWTMDDCLFPLFPVPACVIFGRKRATARPMPQRVRAFCGQLPMRDAPEELADRFLEVQEDAPAPEAINYESNSPYREKFLDGATLYPRKLCLVERVVISSRLGMDASRPRVKSWISTQEKQPWNSVPPIEANVEREFLRPVLLGESILPWRLFRPFEGVIPVDPQDHALLDANAAADRGYTGLHDWMRQAEAAWEEHKSASTKLSLIEQFDYYGKLQSQFPISPLRVVYAASGKNLAACIIRDEDSLIEHALYWHSPEHGEEEAHYLCALFNSEEIRQRVAHLQARGQWGARHFDKVMFTLPIPLFDPANPLHQRLAKASQQAEALAAQVQLPDGVKFQRARKLVREALLEAGIAQKIDGLVAELLEGR